MNVIKNFGSKALTQLEAGKRAVSQKISSFSNHKVEIKADNHKAKRPLSSTEKSSESRKGMKERFIQLKEAIVSKIPFAKARGVQSVFTLSESLEAESLKDKTLVEVLALPLPKDTKSLEERIQHLEERSSESTLFAKDKPVLKTELEHLRFLHSQGPLSLATHQKAMQFKQEAANLVLDQLIATKSAIYKHQPEKIDTNIEAARKGLKAYFEAKNEAMKKQSQGSDSSQASSYKTLQKNIKHANGDAANILLQHNLASPGTSLEALTKLIENTHNKLVLNTQPWEPIEQAIYCYKQDGSACKFRTVLTPALHLGAGFNYDDISLEDAKSTAIKKTEGRIDLREKTIQGLSSEMQHSKHAVNLWKSDLWADGQDGQPQHLGSLYRHGVLAAYQDTSDYRRKEKNLNRAKEVVTAMVHSSENLKAHVKALGDGETLTVPIVSTNLQSSSDVVALVKHFLKPAQNEKAHVQQQMQAWKDLEKAGPFELEVDGKKIKVQAKPIAFNFGVNVLAVRKRTKILSTWRSVKQLNQEAMEALLGRDYVNASLPDSTKLEKTLLLPETDAQGNQNPEAIKKNRAIKALAGQIHDIYTSNAYQAQGVDPYKLVARISALSMLAGKQTSINCKSGKDRTSTCDAEIKHILSTLEMHDLEHDTIDTLLPYDKPLNDTSRKNYQNFIFAKGNFAIQEKNTGIAGYKCGGVPALFEKISDGSSFLKDLFLGGSGMTKV